MRDLQKLLINAIPGFEFPRVDLYNYNIKLEETSKENIEPDDFVIIKQTNEDITQPPIILVDKSSFG